jgi:hypothetical protein
MCILKFACLFFCVLSFASIVANVRASRAASVGTPATWQASVRLIWAIVNVFAFAGAFYGIHRRAAIAWKLGWVVLVLGWASFLKTVLPLTLRVPRDDHPWIACTAVVVGDTLVALYWSFWWRRQKSYFMP